eukprot:5566663-Amphidinium_carterae.1
MLEQQATHNYSISYAFAHGKQMLLSSAMNLCLTGSSSDAEQERVLEEYTLLGGCMVRDRCR